MSPQTRKSVNLCIFATLLLAYSFLLVGLDRAPVPPVDGSIRAIIGRYIVRTGQWFPIHYQGDVYIDHPPLYVWFTAISFKIFGITDFAANLPGRLCAFLTVLIVALTALEAGLGPGVALAAVFILCLTRDFILNSVRGYIEPMMEVFIYFGLWWALRQERILNKVRTRKIKISQCLPAFIAGVCVWLTAFAKGPPALWPFLFLGYFFIRHPRTLILYFFGVLIPTVIWAIATEHYQDWDYWNRYLHEQVLNSALKGRDGAQAFEPFYFVKILVKFYWPWLIFFLWGIWRMIRNPARTPILFATLALGFIVGFSLMRWKFWYYIAPAYPAMALFIAATLPSGVRKWAMHPLFARTAIALCFIWILINAVVPIKLHHERVPEITAFKETVRKSNINGPVWFVQNPYDHNLLGIIGEWYFDRRILKVSDEKNWETKELKSPAWILTGATYFKHCQKQWCRRSKLIQTERDSALVLYR